MTGDTDGWTASHDGIGSSEYRAIKDASGTVVALVVAQSDDHWANLDTETPGRLIAAAPDLLSALRDLEACYCDAREEMSRAERAHHRNVLMAARAAVAKATGAQA
ncbi:MAG TPA: hypothetical protein VGF12_07110 [Roseateles sp.]|uniref:hypothetical protein n=1 Tax=Roseateles sp. TaxID=1971397 RepID=UPI002ED91820